MRKVLISVAIVLGMVATAFAQTKYEQVGSNTFKKVTNTESRIQKGAPALDTRMFYEDSKGKKYVIFISNGGKGSAYIIRTSAKTGKEYKAYLGKDFTEMLKSKLNIKN